jgi:hypothetical protein
VGLNLDHVFVDLLGATLATAEEVDQLVGERRIAELNVHAARTPRFVRSPPPGNLAGLTVSRKCPESSDRKSDRRPGEQPVAKDPVLPAIGRKSAWCQKLDRPGPARA